MFACTLKAQAITTRDIVTAFQSHLDNDFYDALVVRVVESVTLADNSVRALIRFTRGTPNVVEGWYGFHYCEHDARVIVDFLPV